jgi:EAL domain-containing protein (putative c-di-GMP-specific phosphodiesterase class I)
MPGEFIPIAEESGQIVEIGRRTLLQACSQVAQWQTAHPLLPPLRLNFNLSVRQLVDPDLIVDVRNALIGSGLPASSLTLEITESMLMRDLEAAAEQLARLKQLGVTLAIDDFGTGYSSLGYLQHLPVDTVKIDRSFIQALGSDDADPALVRAVVDLAGSLGLDTVAEGIEEGQQLALLRDLACSHGQGYLFAKPLSPAGLGELLAEAAGTVSAAEAVQEHAVNG